MDTVILHLQITDKFAFELWFNYFHLKKKLLYRRCYCLYTFFVMDSVKYTAKFDTRYSERMFNLCLCSMHVWPCTAMR